MLKSGLANSSHTVVLPYQLGSRPVRLIERVNQRKACDSNDLTDRLLQNRYFCLMKELPAPIMLTAVDASRNIRRRYSVRADRNLFGEIEVETAWGRIGTAGQSKVERFRDIESATAYVRKVVARRATAPKRIGVAYAPLD